MRKRIHLPVTGPVIIIFILAAIGLAASPSLGAEEKYPTRPIQIIVGYAPGSTDLNVKPFIEKMPEFLGQPMPFVYKPGAAGSVGASFVAHAKPDGYNLFACSTGPVILGPLTKEGLDFTLDSFAPICRLVLAPTSIAVKADSPMKTLKDVVEAAKASPGKLSYSTSGVLGSSHFAMEIFSKVAGIRLNHIPCPGSAPAVTALLGGHVDMAYSDMAPLMPHVKSGSLRLLGIMTKQRLSFFPDVPTSTEAGYPVVFPVWYGLMGPRALPKAIIEKVSGAAKKVYEQNKNFVDDRLMQIGLEVSLLGPEEMGRENKEQNELVSKILKDLKVK